MRERERVGVKQPALKIDKSVYQSLRENDGDQQSVSPFSEKLEEANEYQSLHI